MCNRSRNELPSASTTHIVITILLSWQQLAIRNGVIGIVVQCGPKGVPAVKFYQKLYYDIVTLFRSAGDYQIPVHNNVWSMYNLFLKCIKEQSAFVLTEIFCSLGDEFETWRYFWVLLHVRCMARLNFKLFSFEFLDMNFTDEYHINVGKHAIQPRR